MLYRFLIQRRLTAAVVERRPGTKRSIVIQTFSGLLVVVRMGDIVITLSVWAGLCLVSYLGQRQYQRQQAYTVQLDLQCTTSDALTF